MVKVVLVNPEIPPNTGNIARTCAATGTELHLIQPLGFELSDRQLKRAGLDYWPHVNLHIHESWAAFTAVSLKAGWSVDWL
jgi:tRNA (cytidine/uridine-2'-O-)-methyltransferase